VLDVVCRGQSKQLVGEPDAAESGPLCRIRGEKKLRIAIARLHGFNYHSVACPKKHEEEVMAWTTPTLVEICIGLEINGYLPAEF
jgi:coenzyme PQQ precursor peptide PqqA